MSIGSFRKYRIQLIALLEENTKMGLLYLNCWKRKKFQFKASRMKEPAVGYLLDNWKIWEFFQRLPMKQLTFEVFSNCFFQTGLQLREKHFIADQAGCVD